jgi:hypothetical protein
MTNQIKIKTTELIKLCKENDVLTPEELNKWLQQETKKNYIIIPFWCLVKSLSLFSTLTNENMVSDSMRKDMEKIEKEIFFRWI